MSGTCIIVTGGDPPHPGTIDRLPLGARVVAADSGLDHADALGLAVDLVLGDLDSVTKEALHAARRRGIPVEEHPVAKDQTDLELAIEAAAAGGADHIVVVSGGGGRLDHLLGGVLALAAPVRSAAGTPVTLEGIVGAAWVAALHGPGRRALHGRPGELLTLLAVGGPADGVRTEGLRYPLRGERLLAGSGRGISNELLGADAAVSVASGSLLVVQPEALEVPA
jgi:thiamine pyrophosphokinase